MIVRDAVQADADAIAAIGRVAFREVHREICPAVVIDTIVEQSYALGALREAIAACAAAPDGHFLVAEDGGAVVGYLQYGCEGPEPELHRIYVEPGLKGRGIGGALVEELHGRLAPGTTYVLMTVVANRAAIAFYRKHGLVEREPVDGVAIMRDRMGVVFPPGTPAVPALLLEFTKP